LRRARALDSQLEITACPVRADGQMVSRFRAKRDLRE
jgi:hypothetical protein